MDTPVTAGKKNQLRMLPWLWLSAPLVFSIYRFSGGRVLDGLFGVYYNQPWHDALWSLGGVTLVVSVVASVTLIVYLLAKKLISVWHAVAGFVASAVIPLVLSGVVVSYFPVHFAPSRDPLCAQGQEGNARLFDVDCSYRFVIGR